MSALTWATTPGLRADRLWQLVSGIGVIGQ